MNRAGRIARVREQMGRQRVDVLLRGGRVMGREGARDADERRRGACRGQEHDRAHDLSLA